MNAFIGRRMRPSSARCRVLSDDNVVDDVIDVSTAVMDGGGGGEAGTAGRGTANASTGVGGGNDQRLAISLVTERTTSGLSCDVIIICVGVSGDEDDDDQTPLVIKCVIDRVISVVTERKALVCDNAITSCLASETVDPVLM